MLKVLLPWKYLYTNYYGRSVVKSDEDVHPLPFSTFVGWVLNRKGFELWGQYRSFEDVVRKEHSHYVGYPKNMITFKELNSFFKSQGYYLL